MAAIGLVVVGRQCASYALCDGCLREIDAASPARRDELFERIEVAVLPTGGTA